MNSKEKDRLVLVTRADRGLGLALAASLPIVVVLPVPFTPTTMMTLGGEADFSGADSGG